MKGQGYSHEGGQSLVMVALALVVLLAFVALAIDVGLAYESRRQMQNAADAGALAGARAYCAQDARMLPLEEADRVARRNGAGSTIIPVIADNIVSVTAITITKTFFAGLVGFPTLTIQATAQARCGSTTQACGTWPIAFGLNDYVEDGINRHGWSSLAACSVAYIWDRNNGDVNCDFYSCDINNDGKDDVLDGGTRGWLDLGCPAPSPYDQIDPCASGGGADCLRCRVDYGYAGLVSKGQCLSAQTGEIQSAVAETGKAPALGKMYWLPLFDQPCDPGNGAPKGYRVEDFGCIQNQGPTDVCFWPSAPNCPPQPSGVITRKQDCTYSKTQWPSCLGTDGKPLDPVWVQVIKVLKECGECYADCSNAGGGFPSPGGVVGVQLVQ